MSLNNMDADKKRKLEKTVMLSVTAILLGFMIYFIAVEFVPKMSAVINSDDKTVALEEFLQGHSIASGIFCLVMLQAFQVISIFIPGAAIQIAGGFVYGVWLSFLVCHLSFVFTNSLVFYLAKRGINPISRLIAKDNKHVKKVTRWIDSSNPAFMIMLAYMMPGVPNGFVPFAAMHTNISVRRFALAAYIGSLVQIFVMCYVGSELMTGDYIVSAALVVVSIIAIIILYKNKNAILNKIDARKHINKKA